MAIQGHEMIEVVTRQSDNGKPMGHHKHIIVIGLLAALCGCSTNDNADLYDRLNAIKAQPASKIPALPYFAPYETFLYAAKNEQDPFKGFAGEQSLATTIDKPMVAPPRTGNPETLEQYPLDTLQYVGQLIKDGSEWAIVTSPDHIVHRVKVGNHLGKNYGEIIQILEDKILIEEIIPDERSGWIKRDAALSLME